MAKFSTGLRNGMLESTGFKEALQGAVLKIYGGAVPADADAAVAGTLLATLTDNGGSGGLNFGTAAGGILSKDTAQVWKTNSIPTTGSATYFRLAPASDDGSASTTTPRLQGTIAALNADMNVSNTLFTAGQPWTLNYFAVALPTLQ
ncbi:hypothetical protein C8245_22900 [Paracidovorax avenae]|uniref:hypothetical protein n=1 Tax=Paracidovorax avenae TaxID=80867 RepID=UPI000D2121B9|nr:hypothetical protein [Paracidovorax avenae]AVS68129.1 hypothetical protein C8245_22900 [Paracidovorax avenae]